MATMRTMAGILAGMAISASYNKDVVKNTNRKFEVYRAVDGSKPTKKRLKVKLSRKANLNRIKRERL